ncbi:MAG TPA: 1,2-phenylacetyl-CoA epoxidase subunit PaaD [Trueperaceae bacterium]
MVTASPGSAQRSAAALAAAAWDALREVKDPELPAVDVVELGIVRDVRAAGDAGPVEVTITPTFSACPALRVIEAEVRRAVEALGVEARVVTALSPPWTSDDMTDEAREKLRAFGIAPPGRHGGLLEIALDAPVRCPRCGHPDTRLRNAFGSTLCREIRTCRSCGETFERFKPL